MKTNKLPKSVWTDSQAAGSQSQQRHKSDSQLSTGYLTCDNMQQTGHASNDASYESELSQAIANKIANVKDVHKATVSGIPYVERAIAVDGGYKKADKSNCSYLSNEHDSKVQLKQIQQGFQSSISNSDEGIKASKSYDNQGSLKQDSLKPKVEQVANKQNTNIPERVFMNGLIKHTGIALAIIIPLAAFSAYAAPANVASTSGTKTTADKTITATLAVEPSDIIHNAATVPTTVASVDLEQYAGTWYEIGRLPMYFQRNCARDVTATYTAKTDGSGIVVTNKCMDKDGSGIVAEGMAKPVDSTGSKLKVTFLPSWIRWLPVGRADYWVLARDANYQTALVGTPDNDYLWLLARSPNITQQTYAKYRQIAQQQGYDLKEFNLTPQTSQTVKLVP